MLTVRDPTTSARRLGAEQLEPMLQQLLTGLFGALKSRGSEENAYVMRAIMRVTVVAAERMAPFANVCIDALNNILGRVCANPTNPTFNHFLFETVASLVRYICAATPSAVDAFESMLFPPFQTVLQADIAEFTPYVFQVITRTYPPRWVAEICDLRDAISEMRSPRSRRAPSRSSLSSSSAAARSPQRTSPYSRRCSCRPCGSGRGTSPRSSG